ncbi:MAG: hypothetical protein IPN17_23475 [Deltaproteobacteria bacterium]|nr:hypothetical protein [Deltaproteobacteria bacterium]
MKRHLASLLLSLPLAAGCGDASSTDAPSDAAAVTDVVSLPDAPSLLDAPASIDVPAAIDAGSTSDTPSSAMPEVPPPPPPPPVDVPVAMADVPPPPPPPPPVMACIATAAIGNGGGTCSGIDQAFSARGINAGYYPFRVLRPIVQFSGDHDGDGATVFSAGPRRRGVVLQTIPAGVYVGLSTIPGNYDPPTGCDVATCGNPSRAACGDSSPALRAPVAGFYWGYAYQGASHMQGWINVPSGALEFAGYDARHPCALGPAGEDYEVRSACGRATACRGTNPTCGQVNRCDEGDDDCGRTQCGAMSGGPLTPTSWRRTVTLPRGHACTLRDPPNPAVRCLENGRDRDFFFVYPFGAYLYWAQNSTTRAWLHYGDRVQVYFHNRDAQGVLWDFVEVLSSGAPTLTPASDGAGAGSGCSDARPENCHPCRNGGTCGWVQDVFLGG